MRGHIRLIDGEGNLVKNKNGGAAFSYAEARRFLEAAAQSFGSSPAGAKTPPSRSSAAHRCDGPKRLDFDESM